MDGSTSTTKNTPLSIKRSEPVKLLYKLETFGQNHVNDPQWINLFKIAYYDTQFGRYDPDFDDYIRLQQDGRLVLLSASDRFCLIGYTFHSIWRHYNDRTMLMAQRRSQCVLPEYRGQGIATKMLELSHEELRRRGVHKVLLNDRGMHRDYLRKIGYTRLETVYCKDL